MVEQRLIVVARRVRIAATAGRYRQGVFVANVITALAIHDLVRGEKGFDAVLGKAGLKVTATIQRIVDELHQLYTRRASKSHGKFAEDDENYPTQKQLREYLKDKDFSSLTSKMMTTLQLQAQRRPAASAGHVFFSVFERDERQYLLVAIVNDKLGAAITGDLDVQDVKHLDVDGFRFAGRINLSLWAEGGERYIGFLKGKGDVSEYFKEFLGCDTVVQDRRDTNELVQALKAFAESENMDTATRDDFLNRAKGICERAARAREEIDFEALANELLPKDPQKLIGTLADPDLQLNDHFVPDRRALSGLVKFKAKTALWSIEFDREALSGGKIVYDAGANELVLKDLPADLSRQLRSEYEVDDKA